MVKRLDKLVCPQGSFLIRIDLDHFHLSGKANDLVNAICSSWPAGSLRTLIGDVAHVLLYHNYVTAESFPGGVWRTITGSGMGLKHSRCLTGLALHNAAGKGLVNRLDGYGVIDYSRFEGDILMVCTSGPGARRSISEFRRRCHGIFTFDIVDRSCHSADMIVPPRDPKFRHAPHKSSFS